MHSDRTICSFSSNGQTRGWLRYLQVAADRIRLERRWTEEPGARRNTVNGDIYFCLSEGQPDGLLQQERPGGLGGQDI